MSIVVCFATVGLYEKASKKLEKSLEELDIKYEIDIIPNRPETHSSRWTSNTHYRSSYLLQKLQQHPGESLLSLDADAIVHSNPISVFESLKCDIAIHSIDRGLLRKRWKGKFQFLPGTLWLNPTKRTMLFLNEWKELASNPLSKGDRFCCANAIRKVPKIKIADPGPRYTFIHDTMRNLYPKMKPIIEHMQLSRKCKK